MSLEVLVTGGRGKTGREVVRLLADVPGARVRVGTSRPMDDAVQGTTRAVRFDWLSPDTWIDALAGVDAVFLVRPDLEQAPMLVSELVARAPHAHVVLLSEQAPGTLDADSWPVRVERAAAGAATLTVLRPSWFHQVLTDARFYLGAVRDRRVLSLPSLGAPIAWVDAADIAAVAVEAIRDRPRHDGQVHTITGPRPITVEEVAALLTKATGASVHAEDPPLAAVLDGLTPWLTRVLEDMYARVQAGDFATVSTVVPDLTGRPSRSLEGFIDDNAERWAPHIRRRPGRCRRRVRIAPGPGETRATVRQRQHRSGPGMVPNIRG
jgi:uncharacterized protein YbjT (DUF2867 family)